MPYQAEAGKGSFRRNENLKAIESNWDKIDWSRKSEVVKDSEDSGCSNTSENVPVGD